MLSTRLEQWLNARLAEDDPWGNQPQVGPVVTTRWEFNDSQGNLDVVPLLISVRSQLQGIKSSWPAFDLAFAAYFSSVRPGETLPTAGLLDTRFSEGFPEILKEIAQDLGATNLEGGMTGAAIRQIVKLAIKERNRWSAFRTNPDLAEVLQRASAEPSPGNQVPDLAAEILWQLSLEIDSMPSESRPIIVVFVDHFERMQNAERGTGEQIVNQFIANMPYAFFVVTGREMLDWYRPERLDLAFAGAIRWPGLVPGVASGPRQHLLDRLSDKDTRTLLIRRRDLERFNMADATIDELVLQIKGWPVHIDAVAEYARRLQDIDPARLITFTDLGGSMASVVKRLLDHLPDDEKAAFQAACVLPSFDQRLVVAVALNTSLGAVERCIARTLVRSNPGNGFPYRVHDEIRRAVRSSGSQFSGGWSEADWASAAARASEHARVRFDESQARDDDLSQMSAIALGIHLGLEQQVNGDWVAEAIKTGPNITGLRPLIPPSDRFAHGSHMKAIAEFIEVLDEPRTDETVIRLGELANGNSPIANQARKWRAYRLRALHRYPEAIAQLVDLIDIGEDPDDIRRQVAVTQIQSRLFVDAAETISRLSPELAAKAQATLDRNLGKIDLGEKVLIERVALITSSRRYQLEVKGTLVVTQARLGHVSEAELLETLTEARNVGHRILERDVLKALGYLNLYHRERLSEILHRIRSLSETGVTAAELELLALRSIAGQSDLGLREAVNEARQLNFRPAGWIAADVFLEHEGILLPEVPTQLAEPFDVVRQRWLDLAARVIDHAGDLA